MLADKLCYPLSIELKENDGYGTIRKEQAFGLTFRERLIIALASNPNMIVLGRGAEEGMVDYLLSELRILQMADKIIKRIEELK